MSEMLIGGKAGVFQLFWEDVLGFDEPERYYGILWDYMCRYGVKEQFMLEIQKSKVETKTTKYNNWN